ncbi:adenosine receptor A1-like [Eucyclogobius newberryi]|uniref:adenosine receptor A1-like n=1 Tax=Eucyclogobius newberryi TaxID=166745 RepID=UPI003B5C9C72
MELMWLYSTCQYILFIGVIACSGRLCLRVRGTSGTGVQQGTHLSKPWSVSSCLRLTLGLVGALGGAVELPVTVILNKRNTTCLYTCITLVCGPLLIRHFTMFLVMLLSLDAHLQHLLAHRYPAVVTCRRALCVVLLSWVTSILSSFAQFIGPDVLHTWRGRRGHGSEGVDAGSAGLGLGDNWTTSLPATTQSPKYSKDLKVIGKFLPYGGFLSKFYVEDTHNLTYAQIHGSHWGVCSADTLLSPPFLVYVYGITVFLLPLVCLLGIYLNLLCMKPKETEELTKSAFSQLRFLALSIFLLVILCAPIHIIHSLVLFSPQTAVPSWVHGAASYLFQAYSLVLQVLFTPPKKQANIRPTEAFSLPARPHFHPPLAPVDTTRGKVVHKALWGAVQAQWASAKNALNAKVCPDV